MTMDSNQFRAVLKGEVSPEEISLEELNEEIRKAPFAASLYVLKAMASHAQQHTDFETCLQKAAARTLSRTRLKDVIEGPLKLEFDWLPSTDTVLDEVVKEPENPEIADVIHETEAVEIPETIIQEPEMALLPDSVVEDVVLEAVEAPTEDLLPANQPGKPAKNEFGFGFVKVPVKKQKGKETPLVPVEPVYQLPAGPSKKKKEKKPEDAIIERFLEKPPAFTSPKLDFGDPVPTDDLAQKSGFLTEEIVTENMAMIYLKQKNIEKALSTFRKLQLKFPEKSDYFAALIKNLESQTKN